MLDPPLGRINAGPRAKSQAIAAATGLRAFNFHANGDATIAEMIGPPLATIRPFGLFLEPLTALLVRCERLG
jgi:hypothetical protein